MELLDHHIEKVGTAGLKLYFLEGPACKVGPCRYLKLGFQGRSHHSLIRMAHVPKLYKCFPSGSAEMGYMVGRGCLCDQSISGEQPQWTTFHACWHHLVLEELIASCVTPWGAISCKFVPGFLPTSCHVPFPCADLALSIFCNKS